MRESILSTEKFLEKTLMDVEHEIYVEKWEISSEDLDLGGKWCIEKRRLYGGLSDSMDIVNIDNGCLSFIVVPTRGMGTWKGSFKGIPIGWNSPIRNLVHPHYVNLEARGGLGWLDGFNEWVVRCGLESFGAPGPDIIIDNMGRKKEVLLTLHGKVANIPASALKARIGLEPPFEIGVTGTVYERSMFGSNLKMTSSMITFPGSNYLKIVDVIENLRKVPDEMQLLYHCNYGPPFLEKGSRFIAPIRRVAPRDLRAAEGVDEFDVYGPPESGFVEQVYFFELIGDEQGNTKVMLVNRDETKAISVSFSLKELPCLTLWKNTNSIEEGYVTGIEPGTSYPNPRAFERKRNRVPKLMPGEKHKASITLSTRVGKEEIRRLMDEIAKIRGKVKPQISKKPISEFSLG